MCHALERGGDGRPHGTLGCPMLCSMLFHAVQHAILHATLCCTLMHMGPFTPSNQHPLCADGREFECVI